MYTTILHCQKKKLSSPEPGCLLYTTWSAAAANMCFLNSDIGTNSCFYLSQNHYTPLGNLFDGISSPKSAPLQWLPMKGSLVRLWKMFPTCRCLIWYLLKVIYHPLYGMNNYVLIWGDWLSCDPHRTSHDSQSPHIWGDWLSCDPLRGSHDSQSPHIRKHLCPILWQLWFICHKIIHTL